MNTCLAGAARICIDPPLDAYPFPTNFCLCGSKYDSCYVRAAAIGNGERTILFAVYELSDIPSIPDLEVQLAQAAGIAPENVILAVTHNHSAPNDRSKAGDYPEKFRLFQTILLTAGRQAAAQAVAALAHLGIHVTVAHAAGHGTERIERSFQLVGDNLRQGCLSHSRRTP